MKSHGSILGNRAALHDAFSNNEVFRSYDTAEQLDRKIEESRYTAAIRLLIKYGAKPLKSRAGLTPLMTLPQNLRTAWYSARLIVHFHKFEASYYGVPADAYKEALFELEDSGFEPVEVLPDRVVYHLGLPMIPTVLVPKLTAIDQFWQRMDALKE